MDFDTHFRGTAAEPFGAAADSDEVEIVCPGLRLSGRLVLGQFKRLSDLFNQSLDFVVLRSARFLQPNGDATDLEIPELMIKREVITFVAQAESAVQPRGGGTGGSVSSFDRPMLSKVARRLIFYVPGSAITADVHLLEEMTLQTFLEGRDRFIPTTDARVRSLADRDVIAQFGLLLVNRDQIAAAAEAVHAGAAAD